MSWLLLGINFLIWKISQVLWKTVKPYKSVSSSFVGSLFSPLPVSLIFPVTARGGWFFWCPLCLAQRQATQYLVKGQVTESCVRILKICFLSFGVPHSTGLYILKMSVPRSMTASEKLNQHTLVQKLPQILWPGSWPKHSCVLASTCQGLRWPKK